MENFFHIICSKNSGAAPIPKKPIIRFLKISNCFKEIQAPILEPTNIRLLPLVFFLINFEVCSLHFEIFPSINFSEDLPCPEYSSAKKLTLFFFAKFNNALGFSPSRSDIKPWRKTIHKLFL